MATKLAAIEGGPADVGMWQLFNSPFSTADVFVIIATTLHMELARLETMPVGLSGCVSPTHHISLSAEKGQANCIGGRELVYSKLAEGLFRSAMAYH